MLNLHVYHRGFLEFQGQGWFFELKNIRLVDTYHWNSELWVLQTLEFLILTFPIIGILVLGNIGVLDLNFSNN